MRIFRKNDTKWHIYPLSFPNKDMPLQEYLQSCANTHTNINFYEPIHIHEGRPLTLS